MKIGAFLCLLSAGVAMRAAIPVWTPAGTMSEARTGGIPFLLADGRVVVVGGPSTGGAVDLFDPATATWSPGPSSASSHPQLPAAVRLLDGRILIAGGREDSGITIASADIYNPSTNSWTATGAMGRSRVGHTLTLLADGRVLAAGGYSSDSGFDNTAELYNPATGTWSFTGSMSHGRWLFSATRVNDGSGRVLVVGGEHYYDSLGPHFSLTEYYNPATASWTAGPPLNAGRAGHQAAYLPDGRLMVAGGVNGWLLTAPLASTEIFDGSSWQPGPSMAQARLHFPLIVMSDGALLATGGTSYNATTSTVIAGAERYDVATSTWMPSGTMNSPRRFHAAIQLADGRVLVAGGQDAAGVQLASSEIMGDGVAPQTTATRSLAPNGNGWNNGNVTITLNAADEDGGSGVQSLAYSLAGAQTGGGTLAGATASVMISAEGTTTLTYHATDGAGNVEAAQSLLVRIDKTLPVLAFQPNVTVPATAGGTVITFNPVATDVPSGVVSVSSSPLSSGMRFPAGPTSVQVTALDAAGNASTTSFTVTVVPSAPVVTVTGGDFVADGSAHAATAVARDSSGAMVAGTFSIAYTPGGASAPSTAGAYSAAASFVSGDPGILSAFPWMTLAPDPHPKVSPTVAAINGKLYVHGFDSDSGGGQSSFVPRLSIYDPASNSWTTGASPGMVRAFASVGVINGKMYVVGGCVTSDCRIGVTNALEIYNPATNTWSNGAPMITGRLGAAAGVIDGRLYVTGGTLACPPCAPTSVTESYDPVTNTWTPGAPIPVPHEMPASAVVNGLLYVIGGYERSTTSPYAGGPGGRVDVYDPAANSWTTRTPMPTARYGAAVGVFNGTIHVAGGYGSAFLATNESYDPQSNTWTGEPPMLTARTYLSAGVVNSKLYVVDGTNGAQLNTNEAFDASLTARITISGSSNHAPLAQAGGPYGTDLGAGLTLDGSGSSDTDAGDSIVQYAWTIDGALQLSGVNPAVTATQVAALGAGPHNVLLTVTDTFGAMGSASTTLSIYTNVPAASFSANPNPTACMQTLTFDGSASSAGRPDRSIVSYAWDFGDGTPVVMGGSSMVNHAYGHYGSFTPTLTVTDSNTPAKTAATSRLVNVNQGNQAPFANAGGSYSVDSGSSLQLSGALSSDPNVSCGDSIVSYAWTIDGTIHLSGVNPTLDTTVNALITGSHTVSLQVTDSFGATSTTSTTLTVYTNVPTASFSANPNPTACMQMLTFNGSASSAGRPDRSIVSYAWSFGDGTPPVVGAASMVNHAYSHYGSYTATLTVTDSNTPARTAATTQSVNVNQGNQPPFANAGGSYSVNAGSAVQLNGSNSSDSNVSCGDTIVSYAWTIDGTIHLSGPNPTLDTAVNALSAGSHPVSLQVTDSFGAIGTSSTTVNVQAVLVSISVSPSAITLSPGQNQTFQAIGHFSDGSTQMLQSGGGGSGPGGSIWNVNFGPGIGLDPVTCGLLGQGNYFGSEVIAVDPSTGAVLPTTWEPGNPLVQVVGGQLTSSQVSFTVTCTTSAASASFSATWNGQAYAGTFTGSGGQSAAVTISPQASGGNIYGQTSPNWSLQFVSQINVSPCATAQYPAPISYSSQGFTDNQGAIHETWSVSTPVMTADGSITPTTVALTLGCTNGQATGTINAQWTGTRYDGTFSFNGGASTGAVSITGWSAKAPMLAPRFSLTAATVNGIVYAMGGVSPGGWPSSVEAYDPATNSWATDGQMVTPREGAGAAAVNGKIYVVGGNVAGGIASGVIEAYDPAAHSWLTGLAPMPTPRAHLAVVTDGVFVYAIGGDTTSNNGGAVSTVERYDPSANGWLTLAP
ncbi:MAG: kelch repeat-containing protein, partial [Vicinamibacterales bacterium]